MYCEIGDFYLDPWAPLPGTKAIITHAHSDHARLGASDYLIARSGAGILRERLGDGPGITGISFGEALDIRGVRVSLHPAGHILGSAQVRLEHKGEVWVYSGDYKTAPDPSCETFELVRCHTFITESTFGLPVYRWTSAAHTAAELNRWWTANQAAQRTTVVFGYALGKAQRVLASLDDSLGPIFVHGAVQRLVQHYVNAGVRMPPVMYADKPAVKAAAGRGLIVAPPSAAGSPWLRGFGETATAIASGWMRIRGSRRRANVDKGLVISDHADWDDLLRIIKDTGATRVGVTHGYTRPLSHYLRDMGLDAWEVEDKFHGEGDEEAVPDGPEVTAAIRLSDFPSEEDSATASSSPAVEGF